jgi:adenosylcobinamide-GDP ribazoletransferase
VLAIAFSVLVRVGALASLDWEQALAALPAAHALGRSGAAVVLAGPPARTDGLGSAYAAGVTPRVTLVACALAVAVAVVSAGAWAGPMTVVAAAATAGIAFLAGRVLGGVTGDVMGAAEQAVEIVVLVLVSALVAADVRSFPWWR